MAINVGRFPFKWRDDLRRQRFGLVKNTENNMNGTCEQHGSFKEIKTERILILCIRKGEMKSPGTYIEERRLEE